MKNLLVTCGCLAVAAYTQQAIGLDSGDYVRRGLVAQWDALENAGSGTHDPAATVWKDLSGNGFDWAMQSTANYSWSARGLEMLGKGCVAKLAHHNKTNFFGRLVTVECVYSHKKASTSGYILDSGYGLETASDGKHPMTLVWFAAGNPKVEQFSPWAPSSSTRYGFNSSIGETNVYSVTYVCPSDTPPTGVKSLAFNGAAHVSDAMGDWWRASPGDFQLGARTKDGSSVPANGTLLALRFYAVELTAEEKALNAAIDQVRLIGKALTDVTPPPGYRFDTDGNLERLAYVWTGNGGSDDWGEPANWGIADGRAATRSPGEYGDKVEIASAAVRLSEGHTAELACLTLGATASLTLVSGAEIWTRTATRNGERLPYGLYGATSTVWAAGDGKVRVGDLAAQSLQYVRDGLVAQWDAFDRSGTGSRDIGHREVWKDLSDNGYDWTLDRGFGWEDACFRFDGKGIVGKMPGRDNTTFANKVSTIELVWQSEDARESIVFNPALGYNALVFTLKKGSFDGTVYTEPRQAGDWIGFTDFKRINFGTALTLGATNVYSVTYVRTGSAPADGKSLYRDGALAELVDGKNFFNSGTEICLGGRVSSYGALAPKGRLMALRVYNRELTRKEILRNQALDRVRYLGADPATALPTGYRFDADGAVVKTGLSVVVR